MENSNKGSVPMHHGIKFSNYQCPSSSDEYKGMSRISYTLAIGLIMYVITYSRPDVSHALSMVSRYHENSRLSH